MVSAAAEASDELMDKYLETGDLTEAEIIKGLRIRTIPGKSSRCCAAARSKTKACSACSMR
jgi:elongation factor G